MGINIVLNPYICQWNVPKIGLRFDNKNLYTMLNIKKIGDSNYTIIAPSGIRFISDWEDYSFLELPNKCIVDKTIPGCGYTEWCIRNNQNVILCSPRKMLLENKQEQHVDDVFLVINEFDKDPNVDRKISKSLDKSASLLADKIIEESDIPETEEIKKQKETIYQKIYEQYLEYSAKMGLKPHKILVTYDSYYIIKSILEHLGYFNNFYTVIDEFQAILSDSRFKSSTELEFMNILSSVEKVQFISATPMLEKYLKMLDDFKDLPIYKIDWETADSGRVIKPNLKVLVMKSIGEVLPGIIENYKNGNFSKINFNGEEVVSDEAVFYLNSVNHIISIIKRCDLKPEEVNILCSRTPDNEKRIKTKLGKKYSIGKVPLKEEKPKMFTFCTRTVYLGADFYSKCAKSYIFGDSNSDCLSIDISQDLPQILGRQRLIENPWKNSATFYYRSTCDWRKMMREDFDKIIQNKIDETNRLLKGYSNNLSLGEYDVATSLAKKYRKCAIVDVYREDYVGVNSKNSNLTPVFNNYVYVSDIRAFDIQQIDYADRFSVFNELHSTFDDIGVGVLKEYILFYESLKDNISERLKFICNLDSNIRDQFLGQLTNDDYAKSYYFQLGPNRCKALSYNIARIKKELGIVKFDRSILENAIYLGFKIGDRLKKSVIKEILTNIYNKVGFNASPKATDLEEWFDIREISMREGNKKFAGFELLKKKREI